MADVCIARTILGEELDLLYDVLKGTYRWVDGAPADAWILGDLDADLSLDALARLSCLKIHDRPADRFLAAFQTLKSSNNIKWRYSIPKREFDSFITTLLNDARNALTSSCIGYYLDVFRRVRVCLRDLGHVKIDQAKLRSYMALETNPSNKSALETLRPDQDGLSKKIVFDQFATVTGRLTTVSGPRVLTLPKRYRDVFVSKYDGGSIVEFDFRSIEPRVVLQRMGIESPDDVYEFITDKILDYSITRQQAKIMIISLLYGASNQTIGQLSGLSNGELKRVVGMIRDFFKLDDLHEQLLDQLKEHKHITNHYGRYICVSDTDKLINYFAQSSSTDAALLGFSNGIEFIKKNEFLIDPIFPIHDAMMFDVHPDFKKYINLVAVEIGNVPGFNRVFPVVTKELHV